MAHRFPLIQSPSLTHFNSNTQTRAELAGLIAGSTNPTACLTSSGVGGGRDGTELSIRTQHPRTYAPMKVPMVKRSNPTRESSRRSCLDLASTALAYGGPAS